MHAGITNSHQGWQRLAAGDIAGAVALFQKVLAQAPDDVTALTGMAVGLRVKGQLRDAILHCDAAIRADPAYAPAWLERGFVFTSGGSLDSAFDCYTQAALLEPTSAAAWAGSAAIAARRGDAAVADDHAKRALALDRNNIIATCALATVELDAGDPDAAALRLTRLLDQSNEANAERSVALNLLGDACHRQGNGDGAFAAYARGKAMFAQIHAAHFDARPKTHRDFIKTIANGLDAIPDVTGWALPDDTAAPNHIFLLGYPRSGTTLVENILASLPNTTALEERPTLRDADQAFLTDADGIARLAALDGGGAKTFRDAYWAKVRAAGALPPTGGAFVDMDPLKATRLPIIARLFPSAKVIIMRRDPRDVVWSCFHTNFALTNAAYEFTDLTRTALHYDAMMRMTELCLTRLPLNAHVVRYDRIVREFEAETRALCAYIGVPWSENIRYFDHTAKTRGVATASAAQVRKPLYDGTRQWERYAEHLKPVLAILQPWVEKFEFER